MATTVSHLPPGELERARTNRERRPGRLLSTLLTPLALAIHGYHPWTEDGGLYLAGVQHLLHPALYPHDTAFVVAPTRFSLFAPCVAALARTLSFGGAPDLPLVVFLLHLATVWATLYAAWLLAERCWHNIHARTGAVVLLACWLALPVAGTSLLLMDPYLTARSFSLPLTILALVGVLDATSAEDPSQPNQSQRKRNGLLLWGVCLIAAAAMHPLMAAYGLEFSLVLASLRAAHGRDRSLRVGAVFVSVCAGALALKALAAPEDPQYIPAALTRSYWFLTRWHWYELVGIAAPVAIVALYSYVVGRSSQAHAPWAADRALSAAAGLCGVIATLSSLLFVHVHAANHLLARLQPMRELQIVYLVMILVLGALLGRHILSRHLWRWALAAGILSGPLYAAARAACPQSRHIELPGLAPENPWTRAFLWIRDNTPADALFALDPDYVKLPGENGQCFRVLAERSVLPDYSKDGGEVSIDPQLAPAWLLGQAAQAGIETEDDSTRGLKLLPLGVSWVVLGAPAQTGLECPYRSPDVKVCRLR